MNDFSRTITRQLNAKGIRVLRPVAIPDMSSPMPFANATRGYALDNNGQHQIRTHREVVAMATPLRGEVNERESQLHRRGLGAGGSGAR